MCKTYVNANVLLFKQVEKINDNVVGFIEPFDCIKGEFCEEALSITGFNILTYINIMGSKAEEKNIFKKYSSLDVKLRFTKCTPNEDERLSIDLDDFKIEWNDKTNIVYDACVPFLNYKRITRIGEIKLDIGRPKGKYVIKVLVKFPDEEKYTVQSMHIINVE